MLVHQLARIAHLGVPSSTCSTQYVPCLSLPELRDTWIVQLISEAMLTLVDITLAHSLTIIVDLTNQVRFITTSLILKL